MLLMVAVEAYKIGPACQAGAIEGNFVRSRLMNPVDQVNDLPALQIVYHQRHVGEVVDFVGDHGLGVEWIGPIGEYSNY